MQVRAQAPPKKPYETPKLLIHGDIHTITRNNTQSGQLDNSFTRTRT